MNAIPCSSFDTKSMSRLSNSCIWIQEIMILILSVPTEAQRSKRSGGILCFLANSYRIAHRSCMAIAVLMAIVITAFTSRS